MMSSVTGAERAEVMVRMTFGPNQGIGFSPDGALLAVCSAHHVEIIDARSGGVLRFPSGGYITLLPGGRYKLDGDPGDCLWWAVGLRRLGPAEAGSRFPEVRRLPSDAPILPGPVR
jgi:hypothetical protein